MSKRGWEKLLVALTLSRSITKLMRGRQQRSHKNISYSRSKETSFCNVLPSVQTTSIQPISLISDVMSMTCNTKVKRGEVAKLTSFSEMLHLHTENTARVVKVEGPSGRLSVSCSPSFTSFPGKLQKSFSFCRSFCETQPIRLRLSDWGFVGPSGNV